MKSRKKGIILVLSIIIIFSIGLLVNNIMTNNKDTAKPKKKTVAAVKRKKHLQNQKNHLTLILQVILCLIGIYAPF